MEKQEFQVVNTTVYQLEFDHFRKGKEVMRNRVYANVQGHRDTPVEELENTARLFAAAPELLATLQEIADGVFCDLRSVEEYAARSIQKVADSIAKAKGGC